MLGFTTLNAEQAGMRRNIRESRYILLSCPNCGKTEPVGVPWSSATYKISHCCWKTVDGETLRFPPFHAQSKTSLEAVVEAWNTHCGASPEDLLRHATAPQA